MRVEICMISARGLPRRSSPIWKLQWFAVGWTDPKSKYCSRMDGSGSGNPMWRTKFSVEVEEFAVLTVEVRSRESIFLREKLHGTASIPLREFLRKLGGTWGEEVGSFQLRGRRSGEPRGFVDVSVRILNNTGDDPSGDHQNSSLSGSRRNRTSISIEDNGPPFSYHPDTPSQQPQRPYIRRRVRTSTSTAAKPHAQPSADPYTPNHAPYIDQSQAEHQSYYRRPAPPPQVQHPPPIHAPYIQSQPEHEDNHNIRPTPPPPPPPANTGFIPSFFPTTYAGMPPAGVGVGVGAGALAAGAVLFGDDFMSGTGFPGGAGLIVD